MRRVPSSVALVALLYGTVAAAQPRPSVTLVPGTVNAGGLNGTRFVSDLALTNPSSLPVTATMTLIPANGTSLAFATVGPGETIVYHDVLDSLWAAEGAGATQVVGTGPLLVRARTYNTAASGTYGVALPVFPLERLLAPGDAADSLWISQSANGASGYRTNIAVVFPDAGGGAAMVSVYDADGNLAGTQLYDLDSAGFQQVSVSSFAGAVSAGRAEIRVMGGHAAGYAVVVDNVTGDSSLFAFEDLPAGAQDVLVNGVARANGRNGTFFRTDGRFYNPGPTEATVSVAFHASQNANTAPVTRTFAVPAGKVRDVVDVLDTLLGLPVGAAGALRFRTDDPVAILCRTSNVDPAGIRPGTFGAQQKPAPLLSFLMSADAGAVVTGIRQNAAFRTNVGFAAGPDGAGYTLTLRDAAGATAAAASGSLGPFGWTQPNVADLFPGAAVPPDATLLVRVTSGSVDVFDSSIDNASGDPVVTPIMSLPADVPSAATIGPAGGSVRSSDGRMTLKVPAGTLSTPADVSLDAATSDAPNGIGTGYLLTVPAEVAGRALLVLSYGPGETAGSGSEGLSIAFKGGDGWYIGMGGSLDPGVRTLTLPLVSTSPPGSPAARVGSLVTEAREITLAVLEAWQIVPEKVVVPTRAQVSFKAYSVGPPTASVSPFPLFPNQNRPFYEKASDPQNVNVSWSVLGLTGSGTITPSGTAATYTAPCKLPPRNPVSVKYDISDARLVYSPHVPHYANVFVLSRYWVGEVDLHVDWCGQDGGGVYDYKKASISFKLDDNLNVTDVVSAAGVAPAIVLCAGRAGDPCTYTPGPAPPARLFIADARGRGLQTSHGIPEFSLMVRYPLSPEVTQVCPDSGSRVIPGQGQTPPVETSVGIPHAPTFSSTDPLGSAGITTRLRAQPDPDCP